MLQSQELVQICASAPALRDLSLRFDPAADFSPLTQRLMMRKLDSLEIGYSDTNGSVADLVKAFALDDSFGKLLSLTFCAIVTMTVNTDAHAGRLLTRVSFANMLAEHLRDLLLLDNCPRIDRLYLEGSTQATLVDCLSLQASHDIDVCLSAERGVTGSKTAAIRVPRISGAAMKKLELCGFAEVWFEHDFMPGPLEELWLDDRPCNLPVDTVFSLSLEYGLVILRFQ